MISTSHNLPVTHQLTLLTNLLIQIQPKALNLIKIQTMTFSKNNRIKNFNYLKINPIGLI